jgi:hypothetical protein
MDASIRTLLGPRVLSVNAALVLLLAVASAVNGAIVYAYL